MSVYSENSNVDIGDFERIVQKIICFCPFSRTCLIVNLLRFY